MVSDAVGGYHGRAELGPLVERGQDVRLVGGGGGGIVAHSSDIAVIRFLRPRCPSVSGVGVLWLTHQIIH